MKTETILIVGASGTVGSGIVRELKNMNLNLRVTTSQASKVGKVGNVETVLLNVATGEGLSAAFSGVDRAFLLSPPGYADHYKTLSPLIQEAKKQNLSKVVLMTAMGANADERTPFRRAEIELEKSGLKYNIIRPNWFLQNFNTFWVGGIREQSKILLPAGKASVSFIDTADVSAVAAKLLVDDSFANQDFDLSGPAAVSHDEVAAAISKATDKIIEYQEIAPEVLKGGLLSAGLPSDYVDFMMLIFGFLREGYNSRTTDNVQKIIGRGPRSLDQYAAANRSAWV